MIAIILGTGKSLNDLPRELLDRYPSYGSNYIGLADIQPTYYVCVDNRLLSDFDGIEKTIRKAKTAWISPVNPKSDPVYLLSNVTVLQKDLWHFYEETTMSGGTVTYVLLKLAFYHGAEAVCLWGVDFDQTWNHFRDDYPCPGNLDRKTDTMMYHMRLAAKVYRRNSRKIFNFSKPSVLDEFFERKPLKEVENDYAKSELQPINWASGIHPIYRA